MRKGQKVKVYEDPITQTKFEGNATLIAFNAYYNGLEMWELHFDGDHPDESYNRKLLNPEAAGEVNS